MEKKRVLILCTGKRQLYRSLNRRVPHKLERVQPIGSGITLSTRAVKISLESFRRAFSQVCT